MRPVADPTPLIHLIEVELVNQYKRFLSKRLAKAPRNCMFNAWTKQENGGYIRECSFKSVIQNLDGQPCTTLSRARKCIFYRHYSGESINSVVLKVTEEFFQKLSDPVQRANSFKALHTLWLLLHQVESTQLHWWLKLKLRWIAIFYQKSYYRHLIRYTPQAELTWGTLMKNFSTVVSHKE